MSDTPSASPATPTSFWEGAEVFRHSRADALAAGDLVEADPKIAREAGFKVPVALTREAHARYVALTPTAERVGNSIAGRLWDVLWMLRCQIPRGAARCTFQLYVVVDEPAPTLVTLRAVIDGGDDGKPVITILCPDET